MLITKFPLSYPWLFRFFLRNASTVLDLGCGKGAFASMINYDHKYYVTGVDLFTPYLQIAKRSGYLNMIVKSDIRKYSSKDNSFDTVICSQVLEHLTKKDAFRVIKKMKKWTRNIIIGVPYGKFEQDEYDNNKLQIHKSIWLANDFSKLGFKVYGQGLRFIYGQDGLLLKYNITNKLLRYVLYLISYLASPIVLFLPQYSTYLIAVWNKNE
jgi:ubiquinone/menaquinone biosynthesis C-methylase UbiE